MKSERYFLRTIVFRLICHAAAILLVCGSNSGDTSFPVEDAALFTEITSTLGLNNAPEPWPNGTYAMPEMTPAGLGLFDYDNDGDLDLLQIRCPPPGQSHLPAPNKLFQQQSDGTFLDVTATSGLGDPGYGQGVAIGDADNDGDLDVYVTNFGRDAFYRNRGDGTFVNATKDAGVSGEHWSTSAALVDYDRDGDLDLYVVHYVVFESSVACKSLNDIPEYCGPQKFEPTLDTLYRNNGNGTFTDVTAEAGISSPGKGLGVVCADLTEDGWVDIYVANDGEMNHLWVNNGDGTFTDEALIRGVGLNGYGLPEASMGVTVGDANGDGKLDLFMTHLKDQTNTLYMATAYQILNDESDASGFATIDLPYTGFGCGFFDYDNDGDLDLAFVNGRVKRGPIIPGAAAGNFWNLYAEPNLLVQNDGDGHFTDMSSHACAFTTQIEVSRGLAFGDIDQDGDIDLVVSNLGNGLRVFRNNAPKLGTHWLRVRVMSGNRDAIGTEVTLVAADRQFLRLVLPGYGYASSNEPNVHFGLGKINTIEGLNVKWPDGKVEHFEVSNVDQEVTIRKGEGKTL